jgi:hypothetical protein
MVLSRRGSVVRSRSRRSDGHVRTPAAPTNRLRHVGYYLFNFSKKGAAKGKTLREQAAELLQVKLWGIGAKTPNRSSLGTGDRVLIYVGAPEYEFIGHAELASPTHQWTPKEAAGYPGSFDGGVAFSSTQIWTHPVSMKNVLPTLELKQTNPNAQFFSGVVRVTQSDYQTVVAAGTENESVSSADVHAVASPPNAENVSKPAETPTMPIEVDLLFKTVEKLKAASGLAGTLSEYDTRAEFIDKYLEVLGYTELGDIQRGSPVDSGNFPDYVLRIKGSPAVAIEAKN